MINFPGESQPAGETICGCANKDLQVLELRALNGIISTVLTLTGKGYSALTEASDPAGTLATKSYVDANAGGAQIQSDYTQTNNTQVDYIKNKPDLGTLDYLPLVGGTLTGALMVDSKENSDAIQDAQVRVYSTTVDDNLSRNSISFGTSGSDAYGFMFGSRRTVNGVGVLETNFYNNNSRALLLQQNFNGEMGIKGDFESGYALKVHGKTRITSTLDLAATVSNRTYIDNGGGNTELDFYVNTIHTMHLVNGRVGINGDQEIGYALKVHGNTAFNGNQVSFKTSDVEKWNIGWHDTALYFRDENDATLFRIADYGVGVMGSPETGFALKVNGNVKAEEITFNTYLRSSDNAVVLGTNYSGTVFIRPNDSTSTTSESTFTVAGASIKTPLGVNGLYDSSYALKVNGDQKNTGTIETTGVDTGDGAKQFWTGTQVQYDAITVKVSTTLYFII